MAGKGAVGDKPPLAGEEFLLHRLTRGGRSLWYQLRIVQQPDRARACGPSTKGETDRRPVDPPPVIALRIFEGPSVEEGTDVTFHYKSNFYMFANLEHARSAPETTTTKSGGASSDTQKPAILGGVPAAGMVYLQRPERAGYFVFSDLCVRYEGRFRLSFTFFESIRDERDADVDSPPGPPNPADIKLRLEFWSRSFNVFTAKKFPGLNQSTELSLVMAQQGCRIRIRRDIRSRRQIQSPDDDQLMGDSPPAGSARPTPRQPLPAPSRPAAAAAATGTTSGGVRPAPAPPGGRGRGGRSTAAPTPTYRGPPSGHVAFQQPRPGPMAAHQHLPPPVPDSAPRGYQSTQAGPPPSYRTSNSWNPQGAGDELNPIQSAPANRYSVNGPSSQDRAPAVIQAPVPVHHNPIPRLPEPSSMSRPHDPSSRLPESTSRLRVDDLVSPNPAPRLRIDYLVSPKSPPPPEQPVAPPQYRQPGPSQYRQPGPPQYRQPISTSSPSWQAQNALDMSAQNTDAHESSKRRLTNSAQSRTLPSMTSTQALDSRGPSG